MPLPTAKRIVDYMFEITPLGQQIKFGFFGGEPLLKFDLIREICSYISEKSQKQPHQVSLFITTNGTLLTLSIAEFLEKTGINLCVSVDGPAHVHNLNRKFRNGRGSHEAAINGLELALKHTSNVAVNAVYTPETIFYLPESVNYFLTVGAQQIHLNFDILSSWNEIASEVVEKIILEITKIYCQAYKNGEGVAINLIDNKILVLLKGGYSDQDRCGMGKTEWGFAPSGRAYPCERLIGDDKDTSLCIGSVEQLIPIAGDHPFEDELSCSIEECINCSLRSYCMNWCGCSNYYQTGDFRKPSPFICASERASIRSALLVLEELRENDGFIRHIAQYVSRVYAQ
jgi:uncharacterized protein